jgi:hypothetical protein
MRWMHEQPEERRQRGEQGRRQAERYQSEALALKWVEQLGHIWRQYALLAKVHGKFSAGEAAK